MKNIRRNRMNVSRMNEYKVLSHFVGSEKLQMNVSDI